jgi:uncharacterized delta-60 repeat protein
VSPSFTANGTTAPIGIIRTNGSYGSVQLSYATTTNGSTAAAGIDYVSALGNLTFADGQTSQAFNIQVLNTNNITPVEKTVNMVLYNLSGPPDGVATFSLSNAVLRIINSSFQGFLNFSTNAYSANLNAGVMTVTVTRTVGSKGTLTVGYATADGPSATNGVDYTGSTNMLTWNNGDVSSKTITIPLLTNSVVGVDKQFGISIFNPTLNGTNTPSLLGGTTNATLTIVNDNSYGVFQFSAPSYVVNESGGFATLTVTRSGIAVGSVVVNYVTADNTAYAGTNYVSTNGSLTFLPGDVSKSFTVPILNDGVQDTNPFNFMVSLSVPPGVATGSLTNVPVNIVDAQNLNRPPGSPDTTFDPNVAFNASVLALVLQSNGQIIAGGNFTTVNGQPENHVARLNPDGTLDSSGFLFGLSGANGAVRALVNQSDDRVVIGGAFSQVNGVVRNGIARLMLDGSLDSSFNPGSGADSTVYALGQTFVGGANKIYVGGAFTTYNSSPSPGIARLNDDGTVDTSFAAGTGANGAVFALAVYPTNSPFAGKVLIGGAFTNFNGTPLNRLARLNADGSMDTNFAASIGSGANDLIRSIAIQSDGGILIGGDFTNFNGTVLNRIERLNNDGTTDTNFTAGVGLGVNGSVNAIALQADNCIVVAGQFTQANGVTRNGLTRLLPTGAADPTINFGAGANADVDAVVIQPADQMLVIGGGFTQFNNESHDHIARIYGGSEVGSGQFTFTSSGYQVKEDGVFATISIRRTGGTSGTNSDGSGNVTVDFYTTTNGTPAGTAVAGVNYSNVATTVSFPPGEVLENVTVPVIDDFIVTNDLTVNLVLTNASASAGIGDQPTATLTILNVDSAISFSSAFYSRAKNAVDGVATIGITRQGSTSGTSTVQFLTTTNGTATPGTDYLPVSLQSVTFNPGDSDVQVNVHVINNNISEGNTTVGLQLTNATGSLLYAPTNATLTIIDTVIAPGSLSFSTTNYVAGEGDTNAYLTIVRSNGSSGFVAISYVTTAGTALPGRDYVTTSNSVTFGDGVTSQTIGIPLLDYGFYQPPINFTVTLSNPTGGAVLINPVVANVTVLNTNAAYAFQLPTNTVVETAGSVLLNVLRLNGTNSVTTVNYATTNGTAQAGVNYSNASGTLTFTNGESVKAIFISVMDNTNVTGDLNFKVNLSSPSSGTQIYSPSNTVVVIQDADAGLSFPGPTLSVLKNVGNAPIAVVCSNPNVEPVSVDFATLDGTAKAGKDYTATNGTLTFTNGITTNTFNVAIINGNAITGDRNFSVRLSNPTAPGQLVAPTNQVVTIVDINSGMKFSSASYTVSKAGIFANINVLRTGYTNSTASVDYLVAGGTALPGTQYFPTNGTLIFTNGQTVNNFHVTVIDNTGQQPNETVLLQLRNPTNSLLLSPSNAVLTIFDNSGSLVVPAGSTLVSEANAGPPNGIIDPHETVTLLFAFRCSAGTNVTSLNATLLATNGITAPSGMQTYGPLVAFGPSAFRPFSFTVDPTYTNGQQIAANFNLKDGTGFLGTGIFTYRLGTTTTTFANTNAIIINDNTNASPYPSLISVSGLGGTLLKATVTLTNLTHDYLPDVDALVVDPGGSNTLIMANVPTNAVSGYGAAGVTFTFDDAALTDLKNVAQIVSGTNKPSANLPVKSFP